SGGRLLLGLGAGWQENEHAAYGIPFHTMRERLERLDEACQVMKSLWTQHRSQFTGRYYQLSDAPLEPKPVQTPHPELRDGRGGARHLPGRPPGPDPRAAPPARGRAGGRGIHPDPVPTPGRAAPRSGSVHRGDRPGVPVGAGGSHTPGIARDEEASMEMKAAVFRKVHEPLTIESVDIDKPWDREVLVRTAAAGVCHSDLHASHGS